MANDLRMLSLLPPEEQLVYAAAWPDPPRELARDLLDQSLDWGALSWLAERERALPMVWALVHSLGRDLPEEARSLQNVAMVNEFRMHHLEQRLRAAVSTLEEAGIETLLLKGAAMALAYYGSFQARPMIDADVLVRPEQARRAWDLLVEEGWSWPGSEQLKAFYEESHHHLPPLLEPTGTGTAIEVHVGLRKAEAPFVHKTGGIWDRSRALDLDGLRTRVPHPIDLLIHLSTHFVWSNQMVSGGFRTFRDAARIAATDNVDWDSFARAAREAQAATCCYWTLRLANSLAGAAFPEELLNELKPPGPPALLTALERSYSLSMFPLGRSTCPSVRLERALWSAGIRPRWSGHRTARPWVSPDPIGQAVAEHHTQSPKLYRQLKKLSQWGSYLGAVLGGKAVST